jgi:hypothetical protein
VRIHPGRDAHCFGTDLALERELPVKQLRRERDARAGDAEPRHRIDHRDADSQ